MSAPSPASHFWMEVKKELPAVRLFLARPTGKNCREEYRDLFCERCAKLNELEALERGISPQVKAPPETLQFAWSAEGMLLCSGKVREVLENAAPGELRVFPFPHADAHVIWPLHVQEISPDAPLQKSGQPQTTLLALHKKHCTDCGRAGSVTVRPNLGKYPADQKVIGLKAEGRFGNFAFVVHRNVGESLTAAGVTGWKAQEFEKMKIF